LATGVANQGDPTSIQENEPPREPSSAERPTARHRKKRLTFTKLYKADKDTQYTLSDFKRDIKSPDFYTEICDVLTSLQDQRQKLEEASKTIVTLRSEVELMEEEIYSLRQHITRIETTPAPATKAHRLPDPPLFSGRPTDDLNFED